jgi:hypothetical protein
MAEHKPVLVMQDTWLRWTKATRAAADAGARLAVPRAHRLPYLLLPQLVSEGALRHEVTAFEADGFEQKHRIRAIGDPAWAQDLRCWTSRSTSPCSASSRASISTCARRSTEIVPGAYLDSTTRP